MKNIIFIVITLVLFQVPLYSDDVIWNKKICLMPEKSDFSNSGNYINSDYFYNFGIMFYKTSNFEYVNCFNIGYYGFLYGAYKDDSETENDQLYVILKGNFDNIHTLLVNIPDGNIIKQFTTIPYDPNFKVIDFDPKKKLLLYKIANGVKGGDFNRFYLKNIETGEIVLSDTISYKNPIPENIICFMDGAISNNGKFAVVFFGDHSVFKIYNLNELKLLFQNDGSIDEIISSDKYFRIYNDGIYVYKVNDDQNIALINPIQNSYQIQKRDFKNYYYYDFFYGMTFYDYQENKYAYIIEDSISSSDNLIYFRKKNDSTFLLKYKLPKSDSLAYFDETGRHKSWDCPSYIAFSSDDSTYLITTSLTNSIQNLNSGGYDVKKRQFKIIHNNHYINGIDIAKDGNTFAATTDNVGYVNISNTKEFNFFSKYMINAVNYNFSDFYYSLDLVLTGIYISNDDSLMFIVQKISTGEAIFKTTLFHNYVSSLSNDGKFLIAEGLNTDNVKVYNIETGKEVFQKTLKQSYYSYYITPDNQYLFATNDSSAQCFRLSDGREIELPYINIANQLAFSSDMTKMLFTDYRKNRLCSVKFNISGNSFNANYNDIINFKYDDFNYAYEGGGTYTFSSSGKEVITEGPRIYNAETGELIKAFDNDEHFDNVFAVSPNSDFIISTYYSQEHDICQELTMWNVKDYLTSVEDNPAQEQALLSLQIIPNPAASQATVSFELQEPSACTIEFRDILGNTVLKENQSALSSGKQSISLDLSSLPTGMYNCILRTGARIEQVKILIVK